MMKLGSQGIAAIYLGGQKIKKAYLGEAVVFDTAEPPEPATYTITLSVDPQGGGTASGGGAMEEGAQVTVTAAAANGYTFSGWRENGTIVSTSPSYTFAVTSDRSLTAVFAAEVQNYNIVTSVDPAGAGTASGGGTYTQGQSVTLQAVPASGYRFVAWREGGADVSTDTAYTFTVSGNRTITAVFAAITYTMTTSTDPVGSGTTIITGTGTYQQGESVTVTASPDDGYKFVKWTEGGQTVSESASYTFTVSGDRVLVAVFEAEQTSRLPAGYTEVEWISPSEKANLLVNFQNTIKVSEMTLECTLKPFQFVSGTEYLYCEQTSGSNTGFFFLSRSSDAEFNYRVGSTNVGKTTQNVTGKKTTIIYSGTKSTISFLDNTVSVAMDDTSNLQRIILFNYYGSYNWAQYRSIACEFYSFKVYNGENKIVDAVPCIDPSGAVGLYDLVNGKFYKPSNGTLAAGPAV